MPKQPLVFESAVQQFLKNGMIQTQKAQKFDSKVRKENSPARKKKASRQVTWNLPKN